MKPDDRLEFMNWYEQKVKSKATFNFKKEINEYCRSDVDILRRACGKFRSMFMQICKFDPFEEAITMSQGCAKIWRKKISCLPKPWQSYHLKDTSTRRNTPLNG